jgi:ubiquinone/menaquinone biosynthesis C-methylase UbiE
MVATMAEVNGHGEAIERVREVYDRIAGRYDPMMAVVDRLLFIGGRWWVTSRAAGTTLEMAVGTGRNLRLYPPTTRVIGIELSEPMLARARQRAAALPLEVDLRIGDAQRLDLPDASVDTVVFTLALCSIPDPQRAVNEAWRVLRPGGRLLALEHVRSPLRLVHAAQSLLQPLFLRAMCDHLLREPLEEVTAAGFDVEQLERRRFGIVERLAATKPG